MERREHMNFASSNRTRELDVSLTTAESAAFDGLRSHAERQLANRLAAELAAGPQSVRLRAAARLVDVAGLLAIPSLVEALDAPESTAALRSELVVQLGRTAASLAASTAPEVRPSIAAAYEVARRLQGDGNALVRAAAVEAAVRLGSYDAAAMSGALREGLDDADPRVRRRAALCAASARGLDPGELLLPLLDDADPQGRRLAVVALGSTAAPDAADALLQALLDEDASVRLAAESSALRLFGDAAAGLGEMPALQRRRAVARLRAQLAANRSRGRLVAVRRGGEASTDLPPPECLGAAEADRWAGGVHPAVAELVTDSVLDRLLADESEGWQAADAPLRWSGRDPEGSLVPLHGDDGIQVADDGPGADDSLREDDELGVDDSLQADEGLDADDALHANDASDADDAMHADDALDADDSLDADDGQHDEEDPEIAEWSPSNLMSDEGFREIEAILRAALRGVEDEVLAKELGFSPLALGPIVEEHLESGRIIRRGKKLFLP